MEVAVINQLWLIYSYRWPVAPNAHCWQILPKRGHLDDNLMCVANVRVDVSSFMVQWLHLLSTKLYTFTKDILKCPCQVHNIVPRACTCASDFIWKHPEVLYMDSYRIV